MVSESKQAMPTEIPIEWIRWIDAGPLAVDRAGDLVFPPVRAAPGIYRFTIKDRSQVIAEYIGQAAVSLVKRFGLYRSRGRNPALPLERRKRRAGMRGAFSVRWLPDTR